MTAGGCGGKIRRIGVESIHSRSERHCREPPRSGGRHAGAVNGTRFCSFMPDARPRGGRRRPETFGRARRRAQRMLIQESGPPMYIASVSGASGSDGSARQYWERTTALYRPTSSPPGVSRFRRRVRKVRQTPLADRCRSVDTENPMVSADAFWSRARDHEPHGYRATGRDAHRLLRRALDLAHARKLLHADNVIARWNVAGRERCRRRP